MLVAQLRGRLLRIAAAIAASAALAACAPSATYSRMSVGGTQSGGLVVGYRTCGERVTSLTVRSEASGSVVWSLKGEPGSSAEVFASNVSDPALTTLVPLAELPPGAYRLTMTTSAREPGTLSFNTSQLQPGYVVWDRGVIAERDYSAMTDEELGCQQD